MTRLERMTAILNQALSPSYLEVLDESHKHAGHAGAGPQGETHYHVVIASRDLQGKGRVQSHQMIYGILQQEFKSGLHALSIEVRDLPLP